MHHRQHPLESIYIELLYNKVVVFDGMRNHIYTHNRMANDVYTECFKKNFTIEFQMLLCGECYERVYTSRHSNYPSFKTLNNG
jgi:hypothetical protein